MTHTDMIAKICTAAPVIPVLPIGRVQYAQPLARALVAGGLPSLEITLRTPAALEVIRALVPFGADMAGQLLIADLLAMRFRTLAVPKDPACPGCAAELCAH